LVISFNALDKSFAIPFLISTSFLCGLLMISLKCPKCNRRLNITKDTNLVLRLILGLKTHSCNLCSQGIDFTEINIINQEKVKYQGKIARYLLFTSLIFAIMYIISFETLEKNEELSNILFILFCIITIPFNYFLFFIKCPWCKFALVPLGVGTPRNLFRMLQFCLIYKDLKCDKCGKRIFVDEKNKEPDMLRSSTPNEEEL
jgi:phage FluMu protein Com